MLYEQRKLLIKDKLANKGIVHVLSLCAELNTSESTIRRDLIDMEKENLLKRVHGGAVSLNYDVLTNAKELTMREKTNLNVDAKERICAQAATYIKDGDCVFFDGGTSIYPMVKYIKAKNVTIVTHSTLVLEIINPNVEIISLGGVYNAKYNMLIGPIAQDNIRRFNFNKAFIGCACISIDDNMSYTAELDSAIIKELAMENSIQTYLLCDKSKIGFKGFYAFKELSEFNKIFTDDNNSLDNMERVYE
ncbi:MAG: DeoR/GlpR family DNA-binding transcription regulator [Erysipelotrichaceae bacterium]